MKQINKSFSVVHNEDTLVKEITRDLNPDDVLVGYASVEVTDSVGDVVVIDGIDWSDYHSPPDTHLKILAGHVTTTLDGSPPVVGRVERLVKTAINVAGQTTPALAFAMSWAKDGEGNLTDLAAKMKGLYDGGYMDSFSVGLLVNEAEPLKESGGWKYTSTRLYEISAVSVPANSMANVLRVMQVLGKAYDPTTFMIQSLDSLHDQVKSLTANVAETGARNNPCHLIEGLCKSVTDMHQTLTTTLDTVQCRLDSLEASLVVMSDVPVRTTDDRKAEPSLDGIAQLARSIRQFAGR